MKNGTCHIRTGLAIVCAAALPATVWAQSNVTLYGTLLPFFDNFKTSGATAGAPAGGASQVSAASYTGVNQASRNRLTSGTSNFGLRGSEDLGNGLKAIFQIESGVPVDGSAGPNTFATRNSNVGLAGAWGTLFLGVWDTPYKVMTIDLGAVRGLNPFDLTLLGNPGFTVPATTTQSGRAATTADAAFNRRQGNSVQYWSPNFSGFSGRIAYSTNEGKTSASASAPSISPDLWSAGVRYDGGGLSVRYAYERHNDYFGLSQLGGGAAATLANSSSKDDAHVLVASYRFATNTRVAAVWERLNYRNDDTTAGNVERYRRNAWMIFLQQFFGPHQIFGEFSKAGDGSCSRVGGVACSTNGLGAKAWHVGYAYSLSKRTDLYTAYYRVDNEASASYTAFPPVPGVATPGADATGYGVGIIHSF